MTWFDEVCTRGLVVPPKHGVKNPVVIVWDKHRGFDVLNLFDFVEGECVTHYMGRRRHRKKAGAKASAHDFSLHTIAEDGDYIIDGTPDSELTVQVMADECAPGSLIQSSRKVHTVRSATAANISNPQHVKVAARKRTILLGAGSTVFRAVSMLGLRTTRFGSSLAWDYDWAAMGGGKSAFTEAELLEATDHYTSIPEQWQQIVEDRRKEYITKGYKDSIPTSG